MDESCPWRNSYLIPPKLYWDSQLCIHFTSLYMAHFILIDPYTYINRYINRPGFSKSDPG